MMKNVKKEFSFTFPLNHKVVRNLKIVNEHVGDLTIEGFATFHSGVSILNPLDERYAVDIDFIKWNGTDVKAVLELTDLIDDIHEAALRHCSHLFETTFNKAA